MAKTSQTPAISIIIPAYNAEKYLVNCLDSIINQTFKDFEIICVNDGSTDNTLKILNDYKNKKNINLTILNTKNYGCSAARNEGIKKSHGKYITFIDADDRIAPNMLEKMLHEAKQSFADVVKCAKADVYENKNATIIRKPIWNEKRIIEKQDFATEIYPQFFGRCRLCTAWATLIKKSVLERNRIVFRTDLVVNEDEVFAIELFSAIDRFIYIPDALYLYTKNEYGLSGNGTNIYERLDSRKKHLEILQKLSGKWGVTNRNDLLAEKAAFTCIYTAMQTSYKNPHYSKKKQYRLFHSILNDKTFRTTLTKSKKTAMLAPEKIVCSLANMHMHKIAFLFSRSFGTIKNNYRFKLEKIRNA